MRYVHCLNNISSHGTTCSPTPRALPDAAPRRRRAILVRSAAMHDMAFGDGLLAIARAGAGVNNIPTDRCAEEGIVVFNTPGANANAVKEIVLCALLLGSRGIVDGIAWCRDNADDPNIAKAVEKAKKQFAGRESQGQEAGRHRPGRHRRRGGERGRGAGHGRVRLRSVRLGGRGVAHLERRPSRHEPGRRLPHLRLPHHPCAGHGRHRRHGGRARLLAHEGWRRGAELLARHARGQRRHGLGAGVGQGGRLHHRLRHARGHARWSAPSCCPTWAPLPPRPRTTAR